MLVEPDVPVAGVPVFGVVAPEDCDCDEEMELDARKGFTGWSWGFGVRINKFHISYGNARYHLAGGSNYFSVSANLADFYKKANNPNKH